jgi:hypothetical protein
MAVQTNTGIAVGLADLHAFLGQFPFLGLRHDLGRAIDEQARRLPRITLDERTWFRGMVAEKRKALRSRDFLPPNPRRVTVPEQRFNHQGQRVFYLSNMAKGAALECREDQNDRIFVQEFRVAPLDGILDLCTGPEENLPIAAATFCGEVRDDIKRPPHLKPQYMVPRFVADCARQAGARGLLVASVEEGTNLVLFHWEDADIELVGDPLPFSLEP